MRMSVSLCLWVSVCACGLHTRECEQVSVGCADVSACNCVCAYVGGCVDTCEHVGECVSVSTCVCECVCEPSLHEDGSVQR